VVKPVVRLDEQEEPTLEELAVHFKLLEAPPGVKPPQGLVTPDFQQNSARLLVLLPSAGTPLGAWDGQGTAAPLLRWAEANGYAVALFSSAALQAAPADVWDRILRGSPARFVGVAVAGDMLPTLLTALSSMHPLLYSRFRAVCVAGGEGPGGAAPADASQLLATGPQLPEDLRVHLRGAMLRLPPAPAAPDRGSAPQQLFELLLEREDRWQRIEANKYAGFQGLKENDMPGLRRMGVEQRIERLDRDRGNDELARLLRKHEKQAARGDAESEDEPGVD